MHSKETQVISSSYWNHVFWQQEEVEGYLSLGKSVPETWQTAVFLHLTKAAEVSFSWYCVIIAYLQTPVTTDSPTNVT